MKSILIILKNIKNLLPYFLLIAIYFFFVNLEARKDKNNNRIIKNDYKLPKDKSTIDHKQIRVRIPVIPYKK